VSSFVSKDWDNNLVVLAETSWNHATIARAHISVGGKYTSVMQTLTDPDVVYDNPPLPGRNGHEVYVRKIEELGTDLVVPVKILAATKYVAGFGNVGHGTRFALTVYTSNSRPHAVGAKPLRVRP
jgi:hypothetical protein